MMNHKILITVAAMMLGSAAASYGIVWDGITWSTATGDVTIQSVTGSGTVLDPYVLTETVGGPDVTIKVSGMEAKGNSSGTGHASGFRLIKYILNDTAGPWSFYDNELQSVLGQASLDGDGLSFGQGGGAIRTPEGNPMSTVVEIDLPRDYINFSGGTVDVGEYLTVEYTITDNQFRDSFWLRQRPNIDYNEQLVPEAASTLGLLGLALAGVGALRRKIA